MLLKKHRLHRAPKTLAAISAHRSMQSIFQDFSSTCTRRPSVSSPAADSSTSVSFSFTTLQVLSLRALTWSSQTCSQWSWYYLHNDRNWYQNVGIRFGSANFCFYIRIYYMSSQAQGILGHYINPRPAGGVVRGSHFAEIQSKVGWSLVRQRG